MNDRGAQIYGRGAALLEVMLAVAIMATSALGLAATQLWLGREARSATIREQAVFMADAVVEAGLGGDGNSGRTDFWTRRASAVVPRSTVAVTASAGGVSVASLVWSSLGKSTGARPDTATTQQACNGVVVTVGQACVALSFVK
ncbi:hypothetical protein CY652_22290 [Burkholderia sp. WAC0059]|nr:hypothetical protein CY652_22290 [Burkholderia sp. WAC0059]